MARQIDSSNEMPLLVPSRVIAKEMVWNGLSMRVR